MNLYRLVLFVSTEFIACTRETMTLLYETENKWARIGEYNKVWDCLRHHFFYLFFFPPTTGLKTENNMALVFRVQPA